MTAKLIKATFEIETDDPTSMSALDEAMARREPVVLVGEHYSARIVVDASDNDVEHMWRVVSCRTIDRAGSTEPADVIAVATLELITEAQT